MFRQGACAQYYYVVETLLKSLKQRYSLVVVMCETVVGQNSSYLRDSLTEPTMCLCAMFLRTHAVALVGRAMFHSLSGKHRDTIDVRQSDSCCGSCEPRHVYHRGFAVDLLQVAVRLQWQLNPISVLPSQASSLTRPRPSRSTNPS